MEVVGPGTPAATAGIAAGDVVVGAKTAAGKVLSSTDEVLAALDHAKPDELIELEVKHGDAAPVPRTLTLIRRPFAVVRPEIENYEMRDEVPPAGFVDPPSFLLTIASQGNTALAGGEIQRLKGLMDDGKTLAPAEKDQLDLADRVTKLLEQGNWQTNRVGENTVEFTRPLPELGFTLVKRYTLEPVPADKISDVDYPGYDLKFDVALRNTGAAEQSVSYQLDGPTGMPTEGWWYSHKISQNWSAAGLRDVSMRFKEGPAVQYDCSRIVQGKVEVNQLAEGRPLLYAGVDGQYFSAVLIPQQTPANFNWLQVAECILVGPKPEKKIPATYANVTCRLRSNPLTLQPGESQTQTYQIFLGPKRPSLLANYHPPAEPSTSLVGLIYYGWFGGVANAMLWILHFFYSIVRNYGIAIIMLTVLVRGAMFPLSIRQTQNMARMQALKPEMDRINEKFKTDMQKRSQATQELYRKNKINPLGGCLPMLLQFPVFIGLYRALMIDVELRNSPLLGQGIRWCSNLAAPDMLFDWSNFMPAWVNNGIGLFGLGPYFNVLPLVTVALFLVTQKMAMPPAANEQAELQQKMMKYMTMFMGILFYKVASGLCLYFIASSLWGIAERKLLKSGKFGGSAPGEPAAATVARGTPKPDRNGAPSDKKRAKSRKK